VFSSKVCLVQLIVTRFTKVKIWTSRAIESFSSECFSITSITNDVGMLIWVNSKRRNIYTASFKKLVNLLWSSFNNVISCINWKTISVVTSFFLLTIFFFFSFFFFFFNSFLFLFFFFFFFKCC